MQDWKTPEDRQKWLTENADYFTIVEAKADPRGRSKLEAPTLAQAEEWARVLCRAKAGSRWMIYAVKGPSDSWIKTVAS